MSAEEAVVLEADEAEPVGESGGMSERTARAILLVVAFGSLVGIIAAFPWLAYVIVGVLGTLGWQKARGWHARRRGDGEGDPESKEPEPISKLDVIEALHDVAEPHVFLADLAAALDVPKDAARALLEHFGIRVRRAVRNGESTGVGVHKDDLPPLPSSLSGDPVDGVDQQQQHNQQANVRVKKTDGGVVIYDLNDAHRHHSVK